MKSFGASMYTFLSEHFAVKVCSRVHTWLPPSRPGESMKLCASLEQQFCCGIQV